MSLRVYSDVCSLVGKERIKENNNKKIASERNKGQRSKKNKKLEARKVLSHYSNHTNKVKSQCCACSTLI